MNDLQEDQTQTLTETKVRVKVPSSTKMAVAVAFLGIAILAAAGAGMRTRSSRGGVNISRGLDVQAVSITYKSKSVRGGMRWESKGVYRNSGSLDTGPFSVSIYNQDSETGELHLLATQSVKNLKPGRRKTFTETSYKQGWDVGAYLLKVDSSNSLNEKNEDNNMYWAGTKFVSNYVINDLSQSAGLELEGTIIPVVPQQNENIDPKQDDVLQEHSLYCNDGDDNDYDKMIDCKDPSCNGWQGAKKGQSNCQVSSLIPKAQLTGGYCPCEYKTEKLCNDGFDNDADGLADCKDSDCANLCSGDVCTGCLVEPENCSDITDNDADGKWDCNDSDCWDQSCGIGCFCKKTFYGGKKVEKICSDGIDNDSDGYVDCADDDCEGFLPNCKDLEGINLIFELDE